MTDWGELARESRNPFATPEFLETWAKHYAPEGSVEMHGELLPLYWWRRRPVRVLRLLGHGPGDQLGPLGEASLEGAVRELRPDVLLAEQLPGDRPWPGRELSREGSPLVEIAGRSWDELLAGWSSNLREQVRRKERKLARERGLSFRRGTPETFDRDLDLLYELHRARWRGESSFERAEPFQREFAARARERAWLRLWFAELDGRAAAAWYGLRYEGADWYYQLGRDPALDRESVGLVLLAHTIREAAGDGIGEYRFGRGGEAYKYRFATADPGLVTVGIARTLAGRAALGAAVLARRVRRAVRDRGGDQPPT